MLKATVFFIGDVLVEIVIKAGEKATEEHREFLAEDELSCFVDELKKLCLPSKHNID